jgi:DNA-binding NarL/FixJ family response regulator
MIRYTVLLVEDDPITRARLVEAIERRPELELLGAAANCAEAREQLKRQMPRVLLTDLGLPDGSGIELIRQVSGKPDVDAMVITVFGDEHNVVSAVEAGATGYLLKDSSADEIGDALARLIAGGSPISAKIARHLVRRFQPPPAQNNAAAADTATLTDREREVLERMAKGFNYAEVARSLEMSPNTVTSHIKNIYRKLAVHSRGEAVFEAAQLGLIRLK